MPMPRSIACRAPAARWSRRSRRCFPGTTGAAGVDRAALGEAVLGDTAALARLEGDRHPAVAGAARAFLARARRARRLVVLDIPLLFEKGGWRRVDAIAVVSAPAWMQRAACSPGPA